MRLDIRENIQAATLSLTAIPEKASKQATVRALNRTITSVRAQAAREMRKDYGSLPIRILKAMMKFTRANTATLTAKLTFSNKRIPLIRWNAVQTSRGVRVKGPKRMQTWGGKEITPDMLSSAFIQAAGSNGVRNVFIRLGSKRYPIEGIVSASLAATYVEGKISAALNTAARLKFQENFVRELRFALGAA